MCDSGTNDKLVMAYKVTRPEYVGNYCIYRNADTLIDAELDDGEVGDKIIVELVQMTEHELDNLPEFEGW